MSIKRSTDCQAVAARLRLCTRMAPQVAYMSLPFKSSVRQVCERFRMFRYSKADDVKLDFRLLFLLKIFVLGAMRRMLCVRSSSVHDTLNTLRLFLNHLFRIAQKNFLPAARTIPGLCLQRLGQSVVVRCRVCCLRFLKRSAT